MSRVEWIGLLKLLLKRKLCRLKVDPERYNPEKVDKFIRAKEMAMIKLIKKYGKQYDKMFAKELRNLNEKIEYGLSVSNKYISE
jgi:hypothetical protein